MPVSSRRGPSSLTSLAAMPKALETAPPPLMYDYPCALISSKQMMRCFLGKCMSGSPAQTVCTITAHI